ncbi:MAG: fused MFS/spermidine synthase [Patescibacteria group bacterium]
MNKISSRFLLLIAFISGFSIMAMEISASRLLAPYFGTSLFIWTNIIGIVLAALAGGYYYGGKLADRAPRLEILLRLIMAAGILFLFIPLAIKPLTSFIDISTLADQPASLAIFFSSLIVTIMLFSLPLLLLGMVSPFIIKLYSLSQAERVGELAGNVFAVSTVGSILGTFLPTLYFIPVLGTRATIYIFAIILILLGILGLKKNIWRRFLLLLFLAIIFFSQTSIKANPDLIFEDESAYQYIQVLKDKEGTNYLIFNEGGAIQSIYNKDKILTGYYYDNFNILPYLADSEKRKNVLILGLAGGTIATQLNYFFKDEIEIDGVEIDKKVIAAAKKYFGLDDSMVKIYNQDGRIFLRNNEKNYDIIIVDAYQNELYIPWTMTTEEFWSLAKSRLNKDGLMAINVNSTSQETDLLDAISNTIASVFKYTYITKVDEDSWNYMITASENELDFRSLTNLIKNKELQNLTPNIIAQTKSLKYIEEQTILTDNRAPIEFLTEAMALGYIKGLMD